MRTAFIKSLIECAERDGRINFVVGDLGYSVVESFAQRFPNRFLNVGVAEQNMTGVATGMALCGKVVFTYSIANFPTLRCLEQVRNDVCYHNANVKIVAVGGGLAYGPLGASHHATEDLAITRALPNIIVVAPGDPVEAALATRAIAEQQGPAYLRLGKAGEPIVHRDDIQFAIGRAIVVHRGKDITLISTGGMLFTSLQVAQKLATVGIDARLLSMHTIKPIDAEAVLAAARETRGIVTIEEHSLIGGLGSAVGEVLMDGGLSNARLLRVALPSRFTSEVGTQDHLRAMYSLSGDEIFKSVRQFMDGAVAG